MVNKVFYFLVCIAIAGVLADLYIVFFQPSQTIAFVLTLAASLISILGISIKKIVEHTIKISFDKYLEKYKETVKAQYINREQAKKIAYFFSLMGKYSYYEKLSSEERTTKQITNDDISNSITEINCVLWELYLVLPDYLFKELTKVLIDIKKTSNDDYRSILMKVKAHLDSDVDVKSDVKISIDEIIGLDYKEALK